MATSTEQLIELLSKTLKYTPIVYHQSLYSTDQSEFGNVYVLEYKHTDLPYDGLLFFVPALSSNDLPCKLTIRVPYPTQDGGYAYSPITFDIIVEENDAAPRAAGKGDIIANRMCVFRFRNSTKQAILCNSPLFNDAVYSKIRATNAEFSNLPKYVDVNNPNVEYTLVSTKELAELEKRVAALESRIKFGTEDPESALADEPTGTIYIQYEED